MKLANNPTYVSLFSAAGLGCYGFKQAGFECLATAELIPRRLEVQRANHVCSEDDRYYLADLSQGATVERIVADVKKRTTDLTAVVATPPCQGMSVANHKKGDELQRNSLVIASIDFVMKTEPRYFIFENVRGFLKATCIDLDGKQKPIKDAIYDNLGARYNIATKIMNLKDYGSPSSRTRTLVVGIRTDIKDLIPHDLLPGYEPAPSLKDLIGGLDVLTEMGEISPKDIYHSFRAYDPKMREWITDLKPGQSAFDNKNPLKRPHRIIDGVVIQNKSSNGDKYRRARWEAVAPCVHTRNDILASQTTVHPEQDRVFSIRELCLMMGVPERFRWVPFSLEELNNLPLTEKRSLLREHEINIRQCLGEGVPTPIFKKIADNINAFETKHKETDSFDISVPELIHTLEQSNPNRKQLAAYYTRQDVAYSLVNVVSEVLPDKVSVLEPSAGAGAFIPSISQVFGDRLRNLDLLDIDETMLEHAEKLSDVYISNRIVSSTAVNFYDWSPDRSYDLVIGNPPFGRTNNIMKSLFGLKDNFGLFIERALDLAPVVAFVIPKSFLSGPEFRSIRKHIAENHRIIYIEDYGESAFNGVLIETIGIVIGPKVAEDSDVVVRSRVLNSRRLVKQSYLADPSYPAWLLYRSAFFDSVAEQLEFGRFSVYRDRKITKKHLQEEGEVPVIKARAIQSNGIAPIKSFCNRSEIPGVFDKIRNAAHKIVVPNLSYYPRAARLPNNHYVDGSAAILYSDELPSHFQEASALEFYSSKDFYYFYRIARNYSVRSLNVDAVSSYFWGVPRADYSTVADCELPTPGSHSLYIWP